jgi:serine/threonine protein kinase
MSPPLQVSDSKLLKKDVFGQVSVAGSVIIRDTRTAPAWLRWLARWLLRREACVLLLLDDQEGCPEVLSFDDERLTRAYIDGKPMQQARPAGNAAYFRRARRLLAQVHRRSVTHNDLAKEANWLVTPEGYPALIDFQLAKHFAKRTTLFRIAAREDIRHLLKHKRTYCPELLTKREQNILANPSMLSRIWMSTGKKVYLLVTRRLLGWADREGADDR